MSAATEADRCRSLWASTKAATTTCPSRLSPEATLRLIADCQAAADSAGSGAAGEGFGRVVGVAGSQAVAQLAEYAVEQVPERGGWPLPR